MSKQGVKAIFETLRSGPVRVLVLAIYSTYNGRPIEMLCRVTSRNNRSYPTGYLVVAHPAYLWEKHRYLGKFGCHHAWQGRPDLSGLTEADEKLITQWEQQR